MKLDKFSIGVGDRFGRQGKAQLQAASDILKQGVRVAPVWNKSNREHEIVGTSPTSVRQEADDAVKALGWDGAYYVDADHVSLKNIAPFVESSDFFTLDVADAVGVAPDDNDLKRFQEKYRKYCGTLSLPAIGQSFEVSEEDIAAAAGKFLNAVKEAGKIYRYIADRKGEDTFITEVSMDETDSPQTPVELFFILAAIADENIPAQTIAPKFTGAFHKGVDYVGDVARFTAEFKADIQVINRAVEEFGLPENLKLSVHSGSDKFSIYGPIHEQITAFDAGLHVKTAGTTWLEEVIGLACGDETAVSLVKDIYANAYTRFDELAEPYAPVIDIDQSRLPAPATVNEWSGDRLAAALRHDQTSPHYNIDFRQLLHIAYKVAAEKGQTYFQALENNRDVVADNVRDNLYERHLKPIFLGA